MPNPVLQDFLFSQFARTYSVIASADNATATATKAAATSTRHFITSVDVAFTTSSTAGTLTVRSGTTVIAQKRIHGAGAFDFAPKGLAALNINELVSGELSASGTGGQLGYVTLVGYSVTESN